MMKTRMQGTNCQLPVARLLGAALDALDHPERVALKQAYIAACSRGLLPPGLPADPYEAITRALAEKGATFWKAEGRLELPGWLTPRPQSEWLDYLTPWHFRKFLDGDQCRSTAAACGRWIAQEILPQVPGLIAVDHSLAGGAMSAVAERYGREAVSFMVLDAHFDGLPTHLRQVSARAPYPALENYHCGNFLYHLLKEGKILPANLVLAGVSDCPDFRSATDNPLAAAYQAWAERGVTFIPKSHLRLGNGLNHWRQRLDQISTPWVYVSLDADAGACAGIPAVRFIDRVGLEQAEILAVADELGRRIRTGQFRLAGFDICEVDVHLLGLDDADPTLEVCLGFIERLLGRGA